MYNNDNREERRDTELAPTQTLADAPAAAPAQRSLDHQDAGLARIIINTGDIVVHIGAATTAPNSTPPAPAAAPGIIRNLRDKLVDKVISTVTDFISSGMRRAAHTAAPLLLALLPGGMRCASPAQSSRATVPHIVPHTINHAVVPESVHASGAAAVVAPRGPEWPEWRLHVRGPLRNPTIDFDAHSRGYRATPESTTGSTGEDSGGTATRRALAQRRAPEPAAGRGRAHR